MSEIIEAEPIATDLTYFNDVEAGLTILETKYAEVPDINTPEGKEAIRLGLAEMRPLRTSVDKRRKDLGSRYRAAIKDINTVGRSIIERIKVIEDPYKAAKKAAEDTEALIEATRIAAIQKKMKQISDTYESTEGETAANIQNIKKVLASVPITKAFGEFQEAALELKDSIIAKLETRYNLVFAAEEKDTAQKVEAQRLKDENTQLKLEEARLIQEANAKEEAVIAEQKLTETRTLSRIEEIEAQATAEIAANELKLQETIAAISATLKAEQAKVVQLARDKIEAEEERLRKETEARQKKIEEEEERIRLLEQEEEAVPEEAVPEEVVPEEAVPEEVVPEEVVPEEVVPEEVVPEKAETVWDHTTSEPRKTVPDKTVMLSLRRATGMGMKMASAVLDAIKADIIPGVQWVGSEKING